MNFLFHEDKKYVEFNRVLVVVVTGIIALAIAMIVLVVFLIQNHESIYSNPLQYGAGIYEATGCSCSVAKGTIHFGDDIEGVKFVSNLPEGVEPYVFPIINSSNLIFVE